MAVFWSRQSFPRSVDGSGLSVATENPTTDDIRRGTVYDTKDLAAASPLWFHPLNSGSYRALFTRRLHDAVVSEPRPPGILRFSSSSESSAPCWADVGSSAGMRFSGVIPSDLASSRVMTSAVSRGSYLFILSQSGPKSLVQHFRVSPRQGWILQGEEFVPAGLALGLYVDARELWVLGSVEGKLSMARKNWGRIGDENSGWRFRTDRGWSGDPEDIRPMPGDFPVDGPVSMARFRNRFYLSVPVREVPSDSTVGQWYARFYTSRMVDRKWSVHHSGVSLGSDASYLGGTAYLQPQLSLTRGYEKVYTSGSSVIDDDSDSSIVYNGFFSEQVTLPEYSDREYHLFNHSVVATLNVVSSGGEPVVSVSPSSSTTLTPQGSPASWSSSDNPDRVPASRNGFPYVYTVRDDTEQGKTLRTQWGAFVV